MILLIDLLYLYFEMNDFFTLVYELQIFCDSPYISYLLYSM